MNIRVCPISRISETTRDVQEAVLKVVLLIPVLGDEREGGWESQKSSKKAHCDVHAAHGSYSGVTSVRFLLCRLNFSGEWEEQLIMAREMRK